MPNIHRAAATGYAVGSDAYIKGRPDYPESLAGWLRSDLKLGPGKVVLDLGAGTGKFLPTLLTSGAAVAAVEPVPEMLAQLRRLYPEVDARAGRAARIPMQDASFDAVICAQAFHWFASPATLAEIHRVLRPGGMLGLVWNVRDETVGWVAALTRIMAPYIGETPRYATMDWRRVFPARDFSVLAERSFPHAHTGTVADVILRRVLSVSFIAALPLQTQDQISGEIQALVAATPTLSGRDIVTFPYITAAYWCTKLS